MTSSVPASICTQEVLALKVPRILCGSVSRNLSTSASEVNCSSRAAHRAALTLPRIVAEDAGEGREPQEPHMIALILTITIFLKTMALYAVESKQRVSRGRIWVHNIFFLPTLGSFVFESNNVYLLDNMLTLHV